MDATPFTCGWIYKYDPALFHLGGLFPDDGYLASDDFHRAHWHAAQSHLDEPAEILGALTRGAKEALGIAIPSAVAGIMV
jgi:hypothetical protein